MAGVSVRVQIELALVTSLPSCAPQICILGCSRNYICNLTNFSKLDKPLGPKKVYLLWYWIKIFGRKLPMDVKV